MPWPIPRTTTNRSFDGSRTFAQLCRKLPTGYHAAPHILPQKLSLPVDRSPNPTTCLIPGPIRRIIPNCIHIRSAVLPQSTGQTHTHTHTDRPTNAWQECLIILQYRPLTLHRERYGLIITAIRQNVMNYNLLLCETASDNV